MFRFSIRELFLITVIAALAVGWWVEHRGKAKASEEATYQEWKNRVLEEALLEEGTRIQADGASVTVVREQGTTVVTPSSHTFNGKNGTRMVMTNIRPKSGKAPDYYYPPARTSSR